MSERDFQRQVMELAELCGWETLHCRTSMQQDRYLTATTGTMAKGWPDLVLIRGSRIIFAELKGEKGRLSPDQKRVLDVLSQVCMAYIWRPSDWDFIEAELQRESKERVA